MRTYEIKKKKILHLNIANNSGSQPDFHVLKLCCYSNSHFYNYPVKPHLTLVYWSKTLQHEYLTVNVRILPVVKQHSGQQTTT